MSQFLCDTHVHSWASHDSSAPISETARACLEKGIGVLAITDHCDIQYYNEQNVPSLVATSVEETKRVANEHKGRVKILTGVEIGEGIWNLDYTAKILNSFDFDVVISSVHAVRYDGYQDPYSTIDFLKMAPCQLDEYLRLYFDEVLEMVKSVPCDIMAHLTCPLRYINGKYKLNIDATRYREQIEKILDYIIENSIAMEINTSGIGKAYGTFMPEEWIIETFKKKGGYLVTIGSDAHTPEGVGNGFESAIELLKKYSFDSYYYYEKRKAVRCKIK